MGIEPATSYSAAHVTTIELPPQGLIGRSILYISINFHDLTMAGLAPPIIIFMSQKAVHEINGSH